MNLSSKNTVELMKYLYDKQLKNIEVRKVFVLTSMMLTLNGSITLAMALSLMDTLDEYNTLTNLIYIFNSPATDITKAIHYIASRDNVNKQLQAMYKCYFISSILNNSFTNYGKCANTVDEINKLNIKPPDVLKLKNNLVKYVIKFYIDEDRKVHYDIFRIIQLNRFEKYSDSQLPELLSRAFITQTVSTVNDAFKHIRSDSISNEEIYKITNEQNTLTSLIKQELIKTRTSIQFKWYFAAMIFILIIGLITVQLKMSSFAKNIQERLLKNIENLKNPEQVI